MVMKNNFDTKYIKVARHLLGINRQELSKYSGVSEASIARLESGRPVADKCVQRIREALALMGIEKRIREMLGSFK